VSRSRLLKKQWLRLTGVVSWLQPVNRGINIDFAILRKEVGIISCRNYFLSNDNILVSIFFCDGFKLWIFIQEYSW